VKFFVDNCISPVITKAVRVLAEIQHNEIVHLSEKFERRDIPDGEWLRVLGDEQEWIVVSGDPRITRGKAELAAWRESGLTAFFFGKGWASQSYWKLAADLVAWWPLIVLKAREAPTGSGFMIPLRGKDFQQLFPPK
jgi:hypothetical protein